MIGVKLQMTHVVDAKCHLKNPNSPHATTRRPTHHQPRFRQQRQGPKRTQARQPRRGTASAGPQPQPSNATDCAGARAVRSKPATGTVKRTQVPLPGEEMISTVPPTAPTRSCSASRPRCRADCGRDRASTMSNPARRRRFRPGSIRRLASVDRDRGGLGVLADVRERLLHRAVHELLDRMVVASDDTPHPRASPPSHGRPAGPARARRQRARRAGAPRAAARTSAGACGRWPPRASPARPRPPTRAGPTRCLLADERHPVHRHHRGDHHLDGVVVELGRDPAALHLLGMQHAREHLPPAALALAQRPLGAALVCGAAR